MSTKQPRNFVEMLGMAQDDAVNRPSKFLKQGKVLDEVPILRALRPVAESCLEMKRKLRASPTMKRMRQDPKLRALVPVVTKFFLDHASGQALQVKVVDPSKPAPEYELFGRDALLKFARKITRLAEDRFYLNSGITYCSVMLAERSRPEYTLTHTCLSSATTS